jgi:hypothetical protein
VIGTVNASSEHAVLIRMIVAGGKRVCPKHLFTRLKLIMAVPLCILSPDRFVRSSSCKPRRCRLISDISETRSHRLMHRNTEQLQRRVFTP